MEASMRACEIPHQLHQEFKKDWHYAFLFLLYGLQDAVLLYIALDAAIISYGGTVCSTAASAAQFDTRPGRRGTHDRPRSFRSP